MKFTSRRNATRDFALLRRRFIQGVLSALAILANPCAQAAVTTYCCDANAEAAYMTALAALGFPVEPVLESFEDGLWVDARTIPQSSVTNLGITWERAGAFLRTSTNGGDAHDGIQVMFTYQQDIYGRITHAIPDGYTLTADAYPLYGVGGWFTAANQAKLSFIVDGDPLRVDFTGAEATVTGWKFLGFIEDDPTRSFSSLEILETDETGDETRYFFSDHFTLAAEGGITPLDSDADGVLDNVDLCPNTPTGEAVDANGCSTSQLDSDSDGVVDSVDNCPTAPNADQLDIDADGIGDVCDDLIDSDGDGVADSVDNCPQIANPDQTDTDSDAIGDACDPLTDSDNDGIADDVDNCPLMANVDQLDTDNDSAGDICDTDDDNDGVLDDMDLCPNTPVGETVDSNGCSLILQDSDGDGVDDSVDNCLLIVNSDQADIDGDGIGDVCDDQIGKLPVITIPEEFQYLEVDSVNVLTNVDLGEVTATDVEDGDLTPTSDQGSPFVPGHHVITWSVTDLDNNTVSAEQILDVIPQASVGPNLLAEAGSMVTVTVFLNGEAAKYPVTIGYTINGVPVAESGSIKIHAGTEGGFVYEVPDDVSGELVVSMGDMTNAIPGNKTELYVQITDEQIAPFCYMRAVQAGKLVRTMCDGHGLIEITADVIDPNVADTHTFDWSQTDSAIINVATEINNQLIIEDTSALIEDNYLIRVLVTDSAGLSNSSDLLLNFVENCPELTDIDSDGDGVSDFDEGLDDEDSDGIPDYLDSISARGVLPLIQDVDSDHLIMAEPGLNLSLGSVAFVTQNRSADITDVIEGYVDLIPDMNPHVGGTFDFQITGLAYPGQSTRLIISLLESIPANAVYRKYTEKNGWHDFVIDVNNSIASAPGLNGICPLAGDPSYVPGLHVGDNCIQMTIQDGGDNDGDGNRANGSISDPGGVAMKTITPTTEVSSGGGGGSTGFIYLLILTLGVFLRRSKLHNVKHS